MLNEGFATYYDALFEEHLHVLDAFLYQMYKNARGFIGKHSDATPMVDRTFTDPMQQFGYRAYPKGSWILHMLRSQLGDSLYHACIQAYLERYAYQNAVTENLSAVIEEKSGRSLTDSIVCVSWRASKPWSLSMGWQTPTGRLHQQNKASVKVLLFDVAVKLRVCTAIRPWIMRSESIRRTKTFIFLSTTPTSEFDPDYTLLAHVISETQSALVGQLEDDST